MAKQKIGKPVPSSSAPRADLEEIHRVLTFMAEHGLEEVDYQRGDFRVRLKRQGVPGMGPAAPTPAPAPSRRVHASEPAPASETVTRAPAAPPPPAENLHNVKSPIVGTFYSAPAPDAPPFVKVGDTVKRGQVLCIIEAMKLMNEIEADQPGEIVRVFVETGHPVEYGQPLFALRPAAG